MTPNYVPMDSADGEHNYLSAQEVLGNSSSEVYSVVRLSSTNWMALVALIVSAVAANLGLIYGLHSATSAALSAQERDWHDEIRDAETRWEVKLETAFNKMPPPWLIKNMDNINALVAEQDRRIRENERAIDRVEVQINDLAKP